MRLDYKPNSVSDSCRIMVIHLVSTSRSSSCDLPIRNVRTTLDCLILLQAGFTQLFMFPWILVVSYTTISPISQYKIGMFTFCCTCHPHYTRGPLVKRRLVLRSSDFPPPVVARRDHFTNLNYSSAPSQNCNTPQLGQLIILLFSFISITVWGGSWL